MKRARVASLGVLACVVVAVAALVLRGGGNEYTLVFENAGQLVLGNEVRVGGRTVGLVDDISLNEANQAEIRIHLDDSSLTELPAGTKAIIRQPSLSSVAGRFVSLQLGNGPGLANGATIPVSQTTSTVDLDQLLNTLDEPTRKGLQQVIQGSATWYAGRGQEANESAKYLAPAVSSTGRLLRELTADQSNFEDLVVNGSKVVGALADRRDELSSLIADANQATKAIADEGDALDAALQELPTTLRRGNSTFVNLRSALDDLEPLVEVSKEQTKDLEPFLRELRPLLRNAQPTLDDLSAIVSSPGPDNDLTDLLKSTPETSRVLATASVNTQQALNKSLPVLTFARPYAPDLVGFFRDFGQANAYYDANGHFARAAPVSGVFAFDPATNTLKAQPANARAARPSAGNIRRCPGSAAAAPADGSAPFTDGGKLDCDPTKVPVSP